MLGNIENPNPEYIRKNKLHGRHDHRRIEVPFPLSMYVLGALRKRRILRPQMSAPVESVRGRSPAYLP